MIKSYEEFLIFLVVSIALFAVLLSAFTVWAEKREKNKKVG